MKALVKDLERFIDELNPNIKGAVRFFWNHGYVTTDSGDGTNYEAGMEGALPYDHVAIQLSPSGDFINRVDYLQVLLDQYGCTEVVVEGTFFPREGICIALVSDPEKTGQLRKLQ